MQQLQPAPKLFSQLKDKVTNMFQKKPLSSGSDLNRDRIPQNVKKTILFSVEAEENMFFVPKELLETKETTGKSASGTSHSTSAIPPPLSPDWPRAPTAGTRLPVGIIGGF
ncbi:hypothetical protein BDP27DRAFT_426784 [Rhodocollybia butyracea]|uniref:Uncharacterized protein n=1 Tax=Rhodocollybia butyracea TaxID=206335 RepID=A0A9P5PTY3_9AGAR|nr:hypothetical protein BDP27DRAFT_426784 [Rhodocollybia butyracea]